VEEMGAEALNPSVLPARFDDDDDDNDDDDDDDDQKLMMVTMITIHE